MKQRPEVWTRTRTGFVDHTERFRLTGVSDRKLVRVVSRGDVWSHLCFQRNPVLPGDEECTGGDWARLEDQSGG